MVEQLLPATATLQPETAAASEAQSPTMTTRSSLWPTDGHSQSEPPRPALRRVRQHAAAAAHQVRGLAAAGILLLVHRTETGADLAESRSHITSVTGASVSGTTGKEPLHASNVNGNHTIVRSGTRTTSLSAAHAARELRTHKPTEKPVATQWLHDKITGNAIAIHSWSTGPGAHLDARSVHPLRGDPMGAFPRRRC